MQIYTIDNALIARGQASFHDGIRHYLGRKRDPRDGGMGVIPGAIVAAIEMGFVNEDEIVPIVARVSRCRESTVEVVLQTLADRFGVDPIWSRYPDGTYALVENEPRRPFTIMAG